MKNFITLIKAAQADDEDAMLEILQSFEPLIMKYTSYMGHDEDFRSELTLKLITFVKTFNLDSLHNESNYAVISYIEKIVRNEYIAFSKNKNRTATHETHFEYEDFANLSESNEILQESTQDGLLYDVMKALLTEREYQCVLLTVIQGYTSEEVGKILGCSKQAINQCKKRALGKLKQLF